MTTAGDPISVVMPVRNAMPFLDEAVASILDQTYGHFEFVIGDDGSTDGSSERLREWAARDKRIRLLRNDGGGLGPSGSANWVARGAAYPLIARMDADDISQPDRLRRQVQALSDNRDAVLTGSLFECIDAAGRRVLSRNRAAFTKASCVFPVAHGSLMFRRDAFERIGGYRPQCDYWEDIDFFIRMAEAGQILILPEAYYLYRFSPTSSRLVSDEARVARATDLCLRCIKAHLDGRDYEAVLHEEAQAARRGKVAPTAMAGAAMGRLWSGDPRSIFAWARRHAAFGWNRSSAAMLTFAGWAWLHSASLRGFLKLRNGIADWRARKLVRDGLVYSWPLRRSDRIAAMSRRRARPGQIARLDDQPRYAALGAADAVRTT